MLVQCLRSVLDPPPPPPEEPPALALIAIGLRMLEHSALHPTWTDRQIAIDLRIHTGEGKHSAWMRAARLYGERSDLVRGLSANSLRALVHPNLLESVRRDEQMLEDGKKITGGILKRMAARRS